MFTILHCSDPCEELPCMNGGTCISISATEEFTCICVAEYTGINCSVNIDDCADSPCENGGTCLVCSCQKILSQDLHESV